MENLVVSREISDSKEKNKADKKGLAVLSYGIVAGSIGFYFQIPSYVRSANCI
jgi:hypothetical protein